MYVKSVIIDGFKSYGKRTEIHSFDSEFTAITGLNGTGKSNILDSICFVLGINNLIQVRATNLQELIYKSGQAGVTRASVTLLFDNSDPNQCPLGYEKCREISVTRQIDVCKKGKYFINGKNVQNKKVTDLFCSVQMNVNNPNFLIMQGRITKVLNMKPPEILSMIEEAAGTSLYETKREITTKIIERKDAKLRETSALLAEEVEPKLEKLRTERNVFVEFQKICRDIEYLTRIHVSYKYLEQKELTTAIEQNISKLHSTIEQNKKQISYNNSLILKTSEAISNIQHEIDSNSGAKIVQLEKVLEENTVNEATILGKIKAAHGILQQEKKKMGVLELSIQDDEKLLNLKEQQMNKFKKMFEALKNADESDARAYHNAQKKYEAIMQGLCTNEDGETTSLQDQLMAAKQNLIEIQTTIKQTVMELNHSEKVLNQKSMENQKKDKDYIKDTELFKSISANIDELMSELKQFNYNDGDFEILQNRRCDIKQEIRMLISELGRKSSYRYELNFKNPENCIDSKKVHGMVGKLFRVKKAENSLALSTCAGANVYSYVTEDDITSKRILQVGELSRRVTFIPMNKLSTSTINPVTVKFAQRLVYSYVTEDDITSKRILQVGELSRRVTFIPMNKLSTSTINPVTVKFAQRLVGEENAIPALSLIHYEECYAPVMKYLFGRTFICKNLDIAKQITYHPSILCRSVTMDGDITDPDGSLSGGSSYSGADVLMELDEIKKLDTSKKDKENQLQQVENTIQNMRTISEKYHQIKKKIDIKQLELKECSARLSLTTFQKNQEEIQNLLIKIEAMKKIIPEAKKKEACVKSKIEQLEARIENARGFRNEKIKLAHEAMQLTKIKSEKSKNNWKKREQEYETLCLEIEDIKISLRSSKSSLNDLNENIAIIDNNLIELKAEGENVGTKISDLQNEIRNQKDIMNSKNNKVKSVLLQKQDLETHIQQLELENKKKENEATKLSNDLKEMYHRVISLENKHAWIKEDKEFFGIKNTRYDYSKEDPAEASLKLTNMLEQKQKMERNVNTRALMLLDREEEQYSEALRRKKIVEEDKEKLKYIIKKMDEKKIEKVENAWRNVNSNFSNIFSTLLPGAQSQLQPIYQNDTLYGLKIRVGFNDVWKESLSELSGGQRSLVALSLVLAMLKFSPAPIYILDEVDAALDMSHTQNIGNMLKAHFKNSQFIIVSLKDGMFNNANVLFRTKFEEGVSSVMRIVNVKK